MNNYVIRGNISPPERSEVSSNIISFILPPPKYLPLFSPQNTFTHLTLYRATYREENGGGILGERPKERRERSVGR